MSDDYNGESNRCDDDLFRRQIRSIIGGYQGSTGESEIIRDLIVLMQKQECANKHLTDIRLALQHRITAISKSGKTVKQLCVFGTSLDAMRHIDQGKARNIAQVLHMAGVPNARAMAALALMLERLDKRSICRLPLSAHRVQAILERYEEEIALVQMPAVIDPGIKSGGVAVRSALVFSMKHLPHKPVLRMIEQIVNGDTQKGDPAYAARHTIATHSTTGENNRYYLACKIIAAAEAQAKGRQALSLCDSVVKQAMESIVA